MNVSLICYLLSYLAADWLTDWLTHENPLSLTSPNKHKLLFSHNLFSHVEKMTHRMWKILCMPLIRKLIVNKHNRRLPTPPLLIRPADAIIPADARFTHPLVQWIPAYESLSEKCHNWWSPISAKVMFILLSAPGGPKTNIEVFVTKISNAISQVNSNILSTSLSLERIWISHWCTG